MLTITNQKTKSKSFAQIINLQRAFVTTIPLLTTNTTNNDNYSKNSNKISQKCQRIKVLNQQKIVKHLLEDTRRGTTLRSTNLTLQWMKIMKKNFSTSKCEQTPDSNKICVQFLGGHFKLQFYNKYQTILAFWQTCSEICQIMLEEVIPNYCPNKDDDKIVKIRIVSKENDENSFHLASSMPIGFLFAVVNPETIHVEAIDKNENVKALFSFKIDTASLQNVKLWSETHFNQNIPQNQHSSKPKSSFIQHEISFLEQERQQLLNEIEPSRAQFEQLVQKARAEAHRKFKIGGLFILSSQLGFVGRLTYFEYSWDIMEPVTWFLTYSLVVGSYAYYMITSEEYIVSSAERRLVVDRFWKLAKSHKFDADNYRQLRERILKLDKQIHKLNAKLTVAH